MMIDLPTLEVKHSHSTGLVRHVIQEKGRVDIQSTSSLQLSARRSNEVRHLKNGQTVMIVDRARGERPASIDGVVIQGNRGDLPRWESHRLIDEMAPRIIAKNGLRAEIVDSWARQLLFQSERVDANGKILEDGLRPPQLGGLHAIGMHWSLYRQAATIVMPTGTGKTETMLAAVAAYQPGCVLVAVPSEILRDQTANKFATFGLLRRLGVLGAGARNPIVGVLKHRPKTESDLDLFDMCNVVVTTMNLIAEGTAAALASAIAEKVDVLIVDEAHHIPASGWSEFRDEFIAKEKHILQFTATPYRRDGKLVDGKIIFEYPLRMAQKDGFFKRINFVPVYEVDDDDGDVAVAVEATRALRADLAAGRDHLMMARCDRIERGESIIDIYKKIAPDLNPVLIHSKSKDHSALLDAVRRRESRIVVAVNMLGEGFDLPQLKVAAIHDHHKSLAVLLQFTGRFTRSAAENIGEATVVANIANPGVSSALERLYSEDADWNELLSELSSSAAKAHKALIDFLNGSRRLDPSTEDEKLEISHHLLRPMLNTLMYHAENFSPEAFVNAMPGGVKIHRVWLNDETKTLYFVTSVEFAAKWTRSKEIRDRQWDLFVLHFDPTQKLLFVSSSDKESLFEGLAKAVGATKLVSGDAIFRSLGRITRLIFQNVGVKKHGRRNLRFAMYTGSDVAEALSLAEKAGSVKSNVSGTGWENGEQTAIGCSYKGRVWTRDPGTIPEFVKWCESIGRKVLDESIDTKEIIKNVMIPKEVSSLPDKMILSLEWPLEILRQSEERVIIRRVDEELPISLFDLELVSVDAQTSTVHMSVKSAAGDVWSDLAMTVGGERGFYVVDSASSLAGIKIGTLSLSLADYLNEYPPLLRFVDLTELDGNILLEPQQSTMTSYPEDRFEVWNWSGTDIRKESLWKDHAVRQDSIQWRAAQHYLGQAFDVVFDDDASGEAADLVCVKEEKDHLRLTLAHCKFTSGKTAGERIKDVQEVCMQAARSGKWKGQFADLCKHVISRDKRLSGVGRGTRFLRGDPPTMNQLSRAARFKEVRLEVVIVQPGLSKANYTSDQARVLGAADSYLKETVGIEMDIIASA
jgi:superfamily II DNA or RNA helicase